MPLKDTECIYFWLFLSHSDHETNDFYKSSNVSKFVSHKRVKTSFPICKHANKADFWKEAMKMSWRMTKTLAKIYFNGPQFLGQSTTPALDRFLQQKRSRLSLRLYFCGPDFYTCLSNKCNILWSRVLHLYISRPIWLVFRGLHTFSKGSQTREWWKPGMWSRVRLGYTFYVL